MIVSVSLIFTLKPSIEVFAFPCRPVGEEKGVFCLLTFGEEETRVGGGRGHGGG